MATTLDLPRSTQDASSTTLSSTKVVWRDVWIYSALAYVIAWAIWSPMFPAALRALTGGMTPERFNPPGTLALGMFAPLVAAIIMRVFVSKEGIRGSFGFKRPLRYYMVAIFGPIVFVAMVLGIVLATGVGDFIIDGVRLGAAMRGAQAPRPNGPVWALFINLLILGVPVTALLTLGEEYGWRGYLLRKLLPLGEVKAGIVVGVIWGAWHLPALLAGLNYPGQNTWLVLAVFATTTILLSMLHTRMFVAAGASVMVVTFLHASLNAFSDRLTDAKHLTGDPLIVSAGGVIAIGILVVATAAVYLERGRARRTEVDIPTIAATDVEQIAVRPRAASI
jgi:membrane protease YdiL (CAAX protease family)